jgi:hypothetical protein
MLMTLVLVATAGCRKANQHMGTIGPGIFDEPLPMIVAKTNPPATGSAAHLPDPLGIIGLVDESRLEDVVILLTQYDTLDLLRLWSGFPDQKMLDWNPQARKNGIRAGDMFRLKMTRKDSIKFEVRRDNYLGTKMEGGVEDARFLRVRRHKLGENETLPDVLARYGVTVDMLEHFNPGIRVALPGPGQVLQIPVMASSRN